MFRALSECFKSKRLKDIDVYEAYLNQQYENKKNAEGKKGTTDASKTSTAPSLKKK